jgi:carbon-monoxide dehydrogenase iron sulfur subunit
LNRTTSHKKIFFRPERCLLCLSCVLACQMKTAGLSDVSRIEKDQKPGQSLKVSFSRGTPWVWKCQQCQNAPCTEACFTGGLHLDQESGTVIQDREACVGCGSCVLACPIEGVGFEPGEHRPDKCDACRDEDIPACVRACQSRALVYAEGERFAADKRKRFVKKLTGAK